MGIEKVDFDEAQQSQLPAVTLLMKLGYKYLSRQEALALRGGDDSKYLLEDVLKRSLMRINSYEYDGERRKFSEADIDMVADELENYELDGLIETSREISAKIMPKLGGASIRVSVGGQLQNRSIRFFDFDNLDNNEFHVTTEYKISARGNIRPDIVCFVNGIPLVVIENKKSSVGYKKAIHQLQRYQNIEFAPKLFIFTQLLLAIDSENAVYGTTGTPEKFFVEWREKDSSLAEVDEQIRRVIERPVDEEKFQELLEDLNRGHKDVEQKLTRSVKGQDRVIYGILRKERLMDIMKNFVFYDGLHKKVARYPQYFAVKKMLKQIQKIENGKRTGGVIWHTQGSGKSLTMVMFVRALIEDENIKNPRVLVVTDRIDLDKQIKGTFSNAGLKKEVTRMKNGQDLLNHLRKKSPDVLTTLIHKFEAASERRGDFYDEDPNIFILIDEVHRSQGGDANLEMLKCLPNACVIGFTGTPLLKKDKTRKQFGEFIDRYTIDDALRDGVILSLIYEGRYVDLYQDAPQIDRWAERVDEQVSDEDAYKIKKRITRKTLEANPSRIEEICANVESHFRKNFQNTGLKGQLVAPSKYAALLMQNYFAGRGLVRTALVISDQSGEIGPEELKKKEVADYLAEIKAKHSSLKTYEAAVIDDFVNNPEGVEMIIVVDKLLTGFDAPCNTVLYLAKELRDHNLLQAIARVNRLYENPRNPKTAGFIIDYSENAVNIDTAMDLFGNFDPEDVRRTLVDVNDKIQELGQSYSEVCDLFRGLNDDNQIIDFLRDEPERKKFVDKYNKFLTVYKESVILQDFVQKIDGDKLKLYREGLKKFGEIKKTAAVQFGDEFDFVEYKRELEKILDRYVSADEAEVLTEPIEITNREMLKEAIEDLGSNKAKAEAIAAQTMRVVNDYRKEDEVLFEKYSKQVKSIIEAMREEKLADIEALKQLRELAVEAEARRDSDLPEEIGEMEGAGVIYRNAREVLPIKDEKLYRKIILEVVEVVRSSVKVDWWRNPEMRREMCSNIDDYLYDVVKMEYGVNLSNLEIEKAAGEIVEIAQNNHGFYSRA